MAALGGRRVVVGAGDGRGLLPVGFELNGVNPPIPVGTPARAGDIT